VSLRAFHVVFIALSALLCVAFGAWAARGSRSGLAAGAIVAALCLVAYGVWFSRKTWSTGEERARRRKRLRGLVLVLSVAAALLLDARPAAACSACYGEADGPMIDAARLGVWLLFGIVLVVQFAFAAFFLVLRRRAREHARRGAPQLGGALTGGS
jgi:amino acid transporter